MLSTSTPGWMEWIVQASFHEPVSKFSEKRAFSPSPRLAEMGTVVLRNTSGVPSVRMAMMFKGIGVPMTMVAGKSLNLKKPGDTGLVLSSYECVR